MHTKELTALLGLRDTTIALLAAAAASAANTDHIDHIDPRQDHNHR